MFYIAYYALNFTFNNISSESFGLKIVNFDGGDLKNNEFGGGISPITQKIKRRPSVYLYGTETKEPMSISFDIVSENEMSYFDLEAVSKWLFGKTEWGWLSIEQNSYEGLFFKGIFSSHEVLSVGNANIGFRVTFNLDSQHVYTDEFTYTYTVTTGTQTITLNNMSNYDGYIFPYLTVTTGQGVGTVTIKNTTDNNRLFSLTGLTGGETVYVDNDRQIISSSLGVNRLNGFNFNFLRLVRGANTLVLNGNGTYILKMRFLKKVGS